MPDIDNVVDLWALHQPAKYSWVDLVSISGTVSGCHNYENSLWMYVSICMTDGMLPCKTFLKAGWFVPTSPKICHIVSVSNGMSQDWENCLPTSSRHAFSSKYWVLNSAWSLVSVGLMTMVSMPCCWFVCKAARTHQVVSHAHSAEQCCFHKDFLGMPFAWAWALIIPAIQVSHWLGLDLNHWNVLYAFLMFSWMVCMSRWKLAGWLVMVHFLPAILAWNCQWCVCCATATSLSSTEFDWLLLTPVGTRGFLQHVFSNSSFLRDVCIWLLLGQLFCIPFVVPVSCGGDFMMLRFGP